jgi:hypothetical protein
MPPATRANHDDRALPCPAGCGVAVATGVELAATGSGEATGCWVKIAVGTGSGAAGVGSVSGATGVGLGAWTGVATGAGRSGTVTRGAVVGRGTGVTRTVGTTRGGCAGAATTGADGVGVGAGRGAVAPVVGCASGAIRGVGREEGRLNPSRSGSGVAGADVCATAAGARRSANATGAVLEMVFTRSPIATIAQPPKRRFELARPTRRTRCSVHRLVGHEALSPHDLTGSDPVPIWRTPPQSSGNDVPSRSMSIVLGLWFHETHESCCRSTPVEDMRLFAFSACPPGRFRARI